MQLHRLHWLKAGPAYDTVWHRGLICKLLRLLFDKHIVRMIMELVGNRSFTLTPVITNRAGYDASRVASHRDLCWHSIFEHLHL